jgi:mono/diheme cytochrome c family protein
MSEESVMKQALSPESPVRVRNGQFRAITLGIGVSALAMACSFGEIDGSDQFDDVVPAQTDANQPGPASNDDGAVIDSSTPASTVKPADPNQAPPAVYNPDEDPFTTEKGKQVRAIIETNCGNCHSNGANFGGMNYILDVPELIKVGKIIPGDAAASQLFVRMQQQSMPPAFIRDQRPTPGQIDVVGQFIDELPVPEKLKCTALPYVGYDEMISAMARDVSQLDETVKPFTRYLTVTYASNAGQCGLNLQRQRFALFKGINSVSTSTKVVQPVAIDENELIFRVDIRDYDWDRDIDLEDDGVVDFNDGWDAIVDKAGAYAVEFAGDQADDLKLDTGTAVPFLAVNAFIQVTETDDLYYSLIGAKANLFTFEKDVLGIDTVKEIADENLMRAGFSNSGVSKQERVLNRFDSILGPNNAYWISFDFDGGNGGAVAGGDFNRANESIYQDPLGFQFAGGEAIFNLPNGMQAYYVANNLGARLGEAPVGVVIDPSQNNGLVVNGASCHTCHNAGMITFTDTVKSYVVENKREFDNETFDAVMAIYPDAQQFQAQMDADSRLHLTSVEKAGIPIGTPDGISRVFLDFKDGNVNLALAAGELGVTQAELKQNLNLLDPRLGNLGKEGGYVPRTIFTDTYTDAICILQAVGNNAPLNCP